MSTLVHSRGEGVKTWSKLVHVVVECPLMLQQLSNEDTGMYCDWLKNEQKVRICVAKSYHLTTEQ